MTNEGIPFDYKEFREKWDILLETKKYVQCEKLCHDGLALSPPDKDRGKLYNHLGFLYENYLEDKTFDDILEHYVLSLQVDESNSTSHYNLSNFLLEQGMQHLLRALELNDKHTKANKKYAQLSPLRVGSQLLMGGTKYRCVEIVDEVYRCVKLRKRQGSDEWEEIDDPAAEIRVGTPHLGPMPNNNNNNNSNHRGNESVQSLSNDPNNPNNNSNSNQNKVGAMNVEDGRNRNDYVQLNSNNDDSKCCKGPCILNFWIWLIIWILAVAGVAAPIVGNFFMNDCEEIDEYSETITQVNDDSPLNILFVTDCNSGTGQDTFLDQLSSIDSMISTIESQQSITSINVGLTQVCNNNTYYSLELTEYTGSSLLNETEAEFSLSSEIYFTQQLQSCEVEYESILDGLSQDATPAFLCVLMVTDKPQDYYQSIEFVTKSDVLDDIYLAYVTMNTIPDDSSVYTFLGSLTYSMADPDNSWFALDIDEGCDSELMIHTYCDHCLYYNDSDSGISTYECNANNIAELFNVGIMETMIEALEIDDYCKMKMYFWYAMGGAGPLLLITLCLLLWICKRCCCNKNRNRNHNNNNDNDAVSQGQLSSHHNHQQQKETAYV